MNDAQIAEAALALHNAEREHRQIRPISLDFPSMDVADSYAIQDAWVAIKCGEGRAIRGRKIGLTSRVMQEAMRINEPDYGTLLDDMFFADGAEIEAARFTDPRVEVELAFVLKRALSGHATLFEVLDATDYVVPAIEIIAARSYRVDPDTGRPRVVLDSIADNAACAGVVLGGCRVGPEAVDLRWVGALLYKNGVIEESGLAAAVLGHPARGIAWLAGKFAPHGISLEPGQVILSGSFTRPVVVAAGDTCNVDYGELGSVSCRFV